MLDGIPTLDFADYRRRVLGCWLGKAVGGTLGGPCEGQPGPLALTFYDPVPDRMLPNDDLDLQVVWVEALRRFGLPVDRRVLADAWLEHQHMYPDEYGVASFNLARGIAPPASGTFDNLFTAGMGAAIRTELWACMAPGRPDEAAAMAYEDACVDHAAEGVYAALYLAALQSAAFVDQDRERLLDLAAGAIPAESRVARAIADARRWWAETGDWRETRARILSAHGRQNFTDVAQNLAFTVLGWLAGDGQFGQALCIAVNCGCDTDCTGATLGALLGILDPDSIGEEWLKPIGRELVLSPSMVGMHAAPDLEAFTDQVAALAVELKPEAFANVDDAALVAVRANLAPSLPGVPLGARDGATARLARDPYVVDLTYPAQVALAPGEPAELTLAVAAPGRPAPSTVVARVPDGWTLAQNEVPLTPGDDGRLYATLTVTPPPAEAVRVYRNQLDLLIDGVRVTAGLAQTLPWRCWPVDLAPKNEPLPDPDPEVVEAAGHQQPLPDEAMAACIEFKAPHSGLLRFVVQAVECDAPRPICVWLDGEALMVHDGTYQVPACHRPGKTFADQRVRSGWHRLTIAVGPGSGGQLFCRMGNGDTWDWIRDLEWRLAEV